MQAFNKSDESVLIQSLHDTVVALEDEVETLREENKRLRNNQRITRTVVRGLREKLTELTNIAEHNDAEFLASVEIADEVVPEAVGGLPDATGTVEPLSS